MGILRNADYLNLLQCETLEGAPFFFSGVAVRARGHRADAAEARRSQAASVEHRLWQFPAE